MDALWNLIKERRQSAAPVNPVNTIPEDEGAIWTYPQRPADYQQIETMTDEQLPKDPELPSDLTKDIPAKAMAWLHQYHIYLDDRTKHDIQWSPSRDRLIFPVYQSDKDCDMILWAGRYVGDSKVPPKWWIEGKVSQARPIYGIDKYKDTLFLVVVEDIVSAINVARVAPCMPLFGLQFPKDKAVLLAADYKYVNLILWLDPDARAAAGRMREEIKVYFNNVVLLTTEQDPKYYEKERVTGFIKHIASNFKYDPPL